MNGLQSLGISKGDAVAIDMTMTAESVAAYLGIIKAGAIVISIPDSLPSQEIIKRLRIGNAKAVLTQDEITRGGKSLPMYQKIRDASAPRTIVLSGKQDSHIDLRAGDLRWNTFLSSNERFQPVTCAPEDPTNIIFSSGTTGDPKAIPWDHTTPIKCGSDGMYHQDIKPGDVVCWPTNLGWMMGPWLVYASLFNRSTMRQYGLILADNGSAIYFTGTPDSRWNNDDLHLLTQITAADFEVVQMGTVYTSSNVPQGSAPSISSLSTSSSTVAAGSPVTLSWNATNASYLYISPIVGPVRGSSVTFSPAASATYTLTATNQYGRTTATVTVNVQ